MSKAAKVFLTSFIFIANALWHPVYAKSWQESIEDVEAKAEQLWEKGRRLGADTFLGTAYNELDVARHRCAILGRMLGRAEFIKELEYHPQPELSDPPTEEEVRSLMLYSHSLSNWAFVAKTILEQSEVDRKQTWNLDCVGRMGIPTTAFVKIDDRVAKFRIEGTDLHVFGDIKAGFSEELITILRQNPTIQRIVLGSAGGNVLEAVQEGFEIRLRGLTTTLSSNCYSACPLVFLGGAKRTIWSPYPTLGFHQMSDRDGNPISVSHTLYTVMEDYAHVMGADPNFVLASMLRAAPSEMFEPDLNSLCEYGVVTWVQRICFGEPQ